MNLLQRIPAGPTVARIDYLLFKDHRAPYRQQLMLIADTEAGHKTHQLVPAQGILEILTMVLGIISLLGLGLGGIPTFKYLVLGQDWEPANDLLFFGTMCAVVMTLVGIGGTMAADHMLDRRLNDSCSSYLRILHDPEKLNIELGGRPALSVLADALWLEHQNPDDEGLFDAAVREVDDKIIEDDRLAHAVRIQAAVDERNKSQTQTTQRLATLINGESDGGTGGKQ